MVLPTSSLVHPQRPHLRTEPGKIFLHFSYHLFQQTFLDRRTLKILPQQRNMFLITILPKIHFEAQTFPSLLATAMPRALLLSLSLWTPILASQSWWSPGEPLPLYNWQQKGNGNLSFDQCANVSDEKFILIVFASTKLQTFVFIFVSFSNLGGGTRPPCQKTCFLLKIGTEIILNNVTFHQGLLIPAQGTRRVWLQSKVQRAQTAKELQVCISK